MEKEMLQQVLSKLDNFENEVKTNISEIKTDINEIKQEQKEMKHDINEMKHEIKEIKQKQEETSHEIKEMKHEIKEIKQEQKEMKHKQEEMHDSIMNIEIDHGRKIGVLLDAIPISQEASQKIDKLQVTVEKLKFGDDVVKLVNIVENRTN